MFVNNYTAAQFNIPLYLDFTAEDIYAMLATLSRKEWEVKITQIPDDSLIVRFGSANPQYSADEIMSFCQKLFSVCLPDFAIVLINGEITKLSGRGKLEIFSLGTCESLKDVTQFCIKALNDSVFKVPDVYVSLARRELKEKLNRFISDMPKSNLNKRIHLNTLLKDIVFWREGLNISFRYKWAIDQEISAVFKSIWQIPEINKMRTDFIDDVYYDKRLCQDTLYKYNLTRGGITYATTLMRRVSGI